MLHACDFLPMAGGMQIIVEVGIDSASYVNEEYQRRVPAPSVCPNQF
jgi:hypothetical protein